MTGPGVIRAPGVGDMGRPEKPEARKCCHEHHVKPTETCAERGLLRKKEFGRPGNSAPLARRGRGRLGRQLAGLDLDERDQLAASGDDIDLAGGASPIGGQDSPPADAQPPAASGLAGATEAIGLASARMFAPVAGSRRRAHGARFKATARA